MPFKDPNVGRLNRASHYHKNKPGLLERHRFVKYGLLPGMFDAMLEAQEGACACCGDLLVGGRATHIDHDHVTGDVRGVVCRTCNLMIAGAMDDPARLLAGVQYLKLLA
jgi:hypothetical protein